MQIRRLGLKAAARGAARHERERELPAQLGLDAEAAAAALLVDLHLVLHVALQAVIDIRALRVLALARALELQLGAPELALDLLGLVAQRTLLCVRVVGLLARRLELVGALLIEASALRLELLRRLTKSGG